MRKDEGTAEGSRTKIDVTCTDDSDVEWFIRVVCVLPGATSAGKRVGCGDTPIGELVGDVKHLGYEVSHLEGIWSKAA